MKKNYNYAYESLKSEKKKLKPYLPLNVLSDIDDSELNQQSLNSLNLALEVMKAFTEDFEDKFISDPTLRRPFTETVYHLYDDPSAEQKTFTYMRLATQMLERYKNDFAILLRDVYKDITKLCEKNDSRALDELLTQSPWMKSVLSEHDYELGKLTVTNGYIEILKIIFPVIKNIEQKFFAEGNLLTEVNGLTILTVATKLLKVATKHQQIDCIKYLLDEGGDPLVIINDSIYYNNEKVFNLINQAIGEDDILVTHCKGVALYRKLEFEKAMENSDKILDKKVNITNQETADTIQISALFYKGLCYQGLHKYTEAKEVYEKIKTIEPKNDNIIKIKGSAEEHLKGIVAILNKNIINLDSEKKFQEIIKDFQEKQNFKEILSDNFCQQFEDYITSIKCISNSNSSSKNITESYKGLKEALDTAKYIKLKAMFNEKIVLTAQFENIIDGFSENLTDQDKQKLEDYKETLNILNNTISLIGEISTGLIDIDLNSF